MPSLSEEQRNILKWAALLHDICKRGLPEFSGRDHIHPFVSGMQVLKIFHRLGLIDEQFTDRTVEPEQIERAYDLIENSIHAPVPESYGQQFKPDEKYCTEQHSHEHLDTLFETLWDDGSPVLKRGSFCDLVFRLVFFH